MQARLGVVKFDGRIFFLAVSSKSPSVRRLATQTPRNRDIRDVVGWLIALIRKPLKYQVRPVAGPGSPGALFVAGQKLNVQRLYEPPPMPAIPRSPASRSPSMPFSTT